MDVNYTPVYNPFSVPEIKYSVPSINLSVNVIVIGNLHKALIMVNQRTKDADAFDLITDIPAITEKYRSGSLSTETDRLLSEVVVDDACTLRIRYKRGLNLLYNIIFELVVDGTVVDKHAADFGYSHGVKLVQINTRKAMFKLDSHVQAV